MTWALPWAWGLAVAAALPLLAHLWSRKRPAPVPFPTLRFLLAASPISRRLRRLQDVPLFLLRLAIVSAVCAAAAGPTLNASWRASAWRSGLHRVLVLDASIAGVGGDVVDSERRAASSSTVMGPGAIPALLDEAIAVGAREAARRRTEIVILWDGSRTALVPADLADIPDTIGLRLVPLEVAGAAPIAAGSIDIRAAAVDEDLRETTLTAVRSLTALRSPWSVDIGWPGGRAASPGARGAGTEALSGALDEMATDPRVREAAERSLPDARRTVDDPDRTHGRLLVRAPHGEPMLRGWADGSRLILELDATPASPLAWWSIVAALESLARPWDAAPAAERWTAADVTASRREAVMPPPAPLPGGLDTRGAWVVALGLLALEQYLRRRPARARVEVAGHGA